MSPLEEVALAQVVVATTWVEIWISGVLITAIPTAPHAPITVEEGSSTVKDRRRPPWQPRQQMLLVPTPPQAVVDGVGEGKPQVVFEVGVGPLAHLIPVHHARCLPRLVKGGRLLLVWGVIPGPGLLVLLVMHGWNQGPVRAW